MEHTDRFWAPSEDAVGTNGQRVLMLSQNATPNRQQLAAGLQSKIRMLLAQAPEEARFLESTPEVYEAYQLADQDPSDQAYAIMETDLIQALISSGAGTKAHLNPQQKKDLIEELNSQTLQQLASDL